MKSTIFGLVVDGGTWVKLRSRESGEGSMPVRLSAAVITAMMVMSVFGSEQAYPQTRSPYVQGHRTNRVAVVRRSGTRIIVTRRSYLDAGTEVIPDGGRKFTNYIFPPRYNSAYVGGFDPVGARFYPLSAPFFPYWP